MPAPTFQTGVLTSTSLNALSAYVDEVRTGLLARGKRVTSSTGTTTEVGVLRIDDCPITGGHTIRVSTGTLLMDTTVNGDAVEARIRYTTDGSVPTVASPTIPGGLCRTRLADAAVAETGSILCTYTPVPNETLSLLLTIGRFSGTGTAIIFADTIATTELFIEDYGTDPGDVGVDI